jgi:hypothetical protein
MYRLEASQALAFFHAIFLKAEEERYKILRTDWDGEPNAAQ